MWLQSAFLFTSKLFQVIVSTYMPNVAFNCPWMTTTMVEFKDIPEVVEPMYAECCVQLSMDDDNHG